MPKQNIQKVPSRYCSQYIVPLHKSRKKLDMQVEFLQPENVKAILKDPTQSCKTLIVDVRDDDFAGGHIRGCVNIPCWELVSAGSSSMEEFIKTYCQSGTTDTLIFHCYLSQQRGPLAARRVAERLNQLDGEHGIKQICVLSHGWRRFSRMYGEDETLCVLEWKAGMWPADIYP